MPWPVVAPVAMASLYNGDLLGANTLLFHLLARYRDFVAEWPTCTGCLICSVERLTLSRRYSWQPYK